MNKYACLLLLILTGSLGILIGSRGSRKTDIALPQARSMSNNATSLIAVIGNPAAFHGADIVVKGCWLEQRGVTALFVSSEAVRAGISKDGIWVDIEELSDAYRVRLSETEEFPKFVTLRGIVDANKQGPNDLYSATLNASAVHATK